MDRNELKERIIDLLNSKGVKVKGLKEKDILLKLVPSDGMLDFDGSTAVGKIRGDMMQLPSLDCLFG